METVTERLLEALEGAFESSSPSRVQSTLRQLERADVDAECALELSMISARYGDLQRAEKWADVAVATFSHADVRLRIEAQWNYATVAWLRSDFVRAARRYREIEPDKSPHITNAASAFATIASVCAELRRSPRLSLSRDRLNAMMNDSLSRAEHIHFVRFASAILPIGWGARTPAEGLAVATSKLGDESSDLGYLASAYRAFQADVPLDETEVIHSDSSWEFRLAQSRAAPLLGAVVSRHIETLPPDPSLGSFAGLGFGSVFELGRAA